MAALAVASVSAKGVVPIQETAVRPWRSGGSRSFQAPTAWLSFPHGCTQKLRGRTWSKPSMMKKFPHLAEASSHQNVSTTELDEAGIIDNSSHLEELQGEVAGVASSGEGSNPDYELLLQEKAEEIREDMNGTCIYLIGIMGSDRTIIGRNLAQALGYYFFDSDDLVEQAAGGNAEIFEDEEGYRDAETEVLRQLSAVGRLVVATGGGSVVRSENWGYLRHGIIVWIDVPLEGSDPNCADDEALAEVSKLYEARKGAFENADAKVSIQEVSGELGIEDPSSLTPTMIAVEVLKKIGELMRKKKRMGGVGY